MGSLEDFEAQSFLVVFEELQNHFAHLTWYQANMQKASLMVMQLMNFLQAYPRLNNSFHFLLQNLGNYLMMSGLPYMP